MKTQRSELWELRLEGAEKEAGNGVGAVAPWLSADYEQGPRSDSWSGHITPKEEKGENNEDKNITR